MSRTPDRIRVLHVHDDPDALARTGQALERESDRIEPVAADGGSAALERLQTDRVDCVVSAYRMDGLDGLDLLAAVREDHPELPFILFTGQGGEAVASEAISAGVTDYLRKRSGSEQYAVLAARVESAVDHRRRAERFEAFIQQSTDIISVLDPDGTYQYLSPSVERITGHEPDALVGDVAFEYVHPDDRERVMATFSEAVAHPEQTKTAEFRFRHRGGSWLWLESIGNNQLDNPAIQGFVVNSREVTERREYERALERKNERLDGFASVISHDLRNPLNVASGRVELAAEECDSEHLEVAAKAHERMSVLIEDLLTLARAGETISDTQPVDLADLVTTCWGTVDTGPADLVTETDAVVQADETRLRQLLENLVRNAVEHGGEAVTVTVGDLEDGEGFYVEDDGPGIPEDERESVFEAGYSTSPGGSGFGLDIVREIVEAHGWKISVTSGGDGGARFQVTGVRTE